MTHTLHRHGTPESLKDDFVWLMYQAKGINDRDIAPKARAFVKAAEAAGCTNWGDVKSGSVVQLTAEEIKARLGDKSRVRGVFTSAGQVAAFLREVRRKDLGISVVISGLLDEVLGACREAGVTPHTINYSLGIWGRKDLLPGDTVLAITTMCGHHMISPGQVRQAVADIRRGRTTSERAARRMGAFCPCGVFNHTRAARLLQQLADEAEAAEAKAPAEAETEAKGGATA